MEDGKEGGDGMNIFCRMGWHRYIFSLVYPPTPPTEIIEEMTQQTKCTRCGDVKQKIIWTWDRARNDFVSGDGHWMMDE